MCQFNTNGIIHTGKNNRIEISYCHRNSSAQKPAFHLITLCKSLHKVTETVSQACDLNNFKTYCKTQKRLRHLLPQLPDPYKQL